jgi:hypothetical protein
MPSIFYGIERTAAVHVFIQFMGKAYFMSTKLVRVKKLMRSEMDSTNCEAVTSHLLA